ncbi:hypothetical protein KP509_28G055200 [Ceratopteris richardii]|nr:hypothetical protein KP509_28G055200 [Ceratopteris richardii]
MVDWLQNRRCSARKKGAPKEIERLSDKESFSGRTPTTITPPSEDIILATPVTPPAGEFDINAVEFEAKSSKDGAWYDVQTFLDHRIFESGPEVRVRFAGYGPEDDEWVDVRTAVRQRSVGCEETDCISIFPGDMVLCYLEGTNQALFYDACVIEVERRKHDIRGCRCRFLVQYVHNGAMGVLPLSKLCRRPENVYADTKPLDNASAVVAKGTK